MAKTTFTAAAAFAPQSAEGVYDPTLDAIAGALATADGLLLGDAESGIGASGLEIEIGRRGQDKAALAGSFTRPLPDYLLTEVLSFSFSFPMVGNRATLSGAPVDSEFTPIRGMLAILEGAGLVGAAFGTGVGWTFGFGDPPPFSALLYYFGNRLEVQDCRCSRLSIAYRPGRIPIATAQIAGTLKDPAAKGFAVSALPTLDYGVQASISGAVCEQVAHFYGASRGFTEAEVTFEGEVDEQPDSNAVDGITKEPSDRRCRYEATLYVDDAGTNEVFDLNQLFADTAGDLGLVTWQVGSSGAPAGIARAHQIMIPTLELVSSKPDRAGTKAVNRVSGIARAAVANAEVSLTFR